MRQHKSLVFGVLGYVIMWAIGTDHGVIGLMTVGVAIGYLNYEFTHYVDHHCQINLKLFKQHKMRHAIHHHRDDSVNFGVTTQFWDRVFGTLKLSA